MAVSEHRQIINYFKQRTGQEIEVNGINRRGTEVYNYTTVSIDYPAYKASADMQIVQNEECPGIGYMSEYQISSDNGQYDRVICTFMEVRNINSLYDRAVYSKLAAPTAALPLERKTYVISVGDDEAYRTWWNHHVVSTNVDELITVADWKYMGAGTDGDMTGYLERPASYEYEKGSDKAASWQKTNQGLKSNQEVLLSASMPGVQSFLHPITEIVQTVYTTSDNVLNEYVTNNGRCFTPRGSNGDYYTLGVEQSDDETPIIKPWLIAGVNVDKKFGWYIITVSYKYANQGWQTEIYPYATGMYKGHFSVG